MSNSRRHRRNGGRHGGDLDAYRRRAAVARPIVDSYFAEYVLDAADPPHRAGATCATEAEQCWEDVKLALLGFGDGADLPTELFERLVAVDPLWEAV